MQSQDNKTLAKDTSRRQHFRYATILLVMASPILLYGFSEYYFKYFWSVPQRYHAHAIPAIGWLALLVIQPILYHWGKLKGHRILGRILELAWRSYHSRVS